MSSTCLLITKGDTGKGTEDMEIHPAVQTLCGRTQEQQGLCLLSQKKKNVVHKTREKSKQPNYTGKEGVPWRK